MRGLVGPDGMSALPGGVVDTSAGADDIEVPPEVQEKLAKIYADAELDAMKAKYKLEVAFNEERSIHHPFTGVIAAFTNGGFAHGGGDEAIYFCPSLVDKKGEKKTCSAPLELKWIGKEAAVCPTCRQAIDPKKLAGQIGGKLTLDGWTDLLTKMWILLDSNADIRIGVLGGKIIQRTDDIMKKVSVSAGDRLNEARERRRWSIYPLRNIIKDTSAGADLRKRIRAFLSA